MTNRLFSLVFGLVMCKAITPEILAQYAKYADEYRCGHDSLTIISSPVDYVVPDGSVNPHPHGRGGGGFA